MIPLAVLMAGALALGLRLAKLACGPGASRLALYAFGTASGAAALGAAGLLVALLGAPLGRGLVVSLAVGAGAFALLTRSPQSRPASSGWPRPRSLADRWTFLMLAVVALLVVLTVVTTPLVSVDARTLWTPHARLIADTGRYPAPELRDPAFVIAHASYPPLLPMMEALVALASGSTDERLLRAVPTVFYFSTAALLLAELPRREPRWGILLAAAWALMPTLIVFEEGGADAGLADVAVSGFVLMSAVLLERAPRLSLAAPALAGGLAAAAALTKNEGLVLGGLLCLSAWIFGPRGRRAGVMTVVFLLLIGPWLAVRPNLASILDESYLSHLGWERFSAEAPRAGAVATEMLEQAFLLPHRAGLFWWLVGAWFAASRRKAEALGPDRLGIVPLYLLVVFVLYLVTPWEGTVQVQLSFSRVLLQVAPLALWAVAGEGATTAPAEAPSG
jgi:hypothetical protein